MGNFFTFRKGGKKKIICHNESGGGRRGGRVEGGGEDGDGLEHRGRGRVVRATGGSQFNFEKKSIFYVVGEIVTNLSKNFLTHTDRRIVKNSLLNI